MTVESKISLDGKLEIRPSRRTTIAKYNNDRFILKIKQWFSNVE
jgi:hypothetical protein